MQVDALQAVGRERTFAETASGASKEKPELASALSHSCAGDTLVVWRLDRLCRSLPHLIEIVSGPVQAGVRLRGFTEGVDTTSLNGGSIPHFFGALAEFERELIKERTRAGLAAARARRHKGGGPPKLGGNKTRIGGRLLAGADTTVSEVAQTLRVHRSTLHEALSAESEAMRHRGKAHAEQRPASWQRPTGPADLTQTGADGPGKHGGQTK